MPDIELKIKVPMNENPLESVLMIQTQIASFATEMALFHQDNESKGIIWEDFARTYSWLGLLLTEPFPNELFKMHDFRNNSLIKLKAKQNENQKS